MIELDEKTRVKITYELTSNIAQFENLKPRLEVTCDINNTEKYLNWCRTMLKGEYQRIKSKETGKNEDTTQ